MTNKIISLKFIGALIVLTALSFSCVKKDGWAFQDGTPGDGGIASVTVDTSLKFVDVSKYAQARVFPGLVCADEPRLKDYKLKMDLNYNYVEENLRINVPPQPQFSTGLYAAPGELVILDVPQGDYSLSVQIGAWTDNLTNIQNAPRDPVIVTRLQLAPGRNFIRNLYGGHIYIFAGRPIATPVNLVFTNVVKSPDFILGKTTDAEWKTMIQKSCVPYLELRSENLIFVVPREYCVNKPIPSPTVLMTEWDNALNLDYYQWEGLVENSTNEYDKAPLLPWRVVQDIKPSAGYGHSGFPIVTYNDYGWYNEFTELSQIQGGGAWGTFHEIGHNNQQPRYWSWSSLGETSNNLFVFKVAHRQDAVHPGAWPPKHPALPNMIPKALAFAAEDNAGKNFDGTDARISDPFARLTPFLQIFDKIPANWGYPGQPDGWSFMTELYKKARRAPRISLNDQAKRDFTYETLCDFTKTDWQLFFKAWGIQISSLSVNKMSAIYPLLTQEIWKYNPLTRTGGNTFFDLYSRSGWSITASSEEASGEGAAPQGRAVAVLDGNLNTFWHSNWAGSNPNPPHWLRIDMGKSLSIKGFKIAQRSGNQAVKNIKIETSSNGTDWSVISGSPVLLKQIAGLQLFELPSAINCRYFRLTIGSNADTWGGGKYAMLGEVDVIKP